MKGRENSRETGTLEIQIQVETAQLPALAMRTVLRICKTHTFEDGSLIFQSKTLL